VSNKKYRNKKTGKIYFLINNRIINATNANDGQIMVLYKNENGDLFVRERKEFLIKFEEEKMKVKKELLLKVIEGIEHWASLEDNEVPGPLYKPYKELKALLEWEEE